MGALRAAKGSMRDGGAEGGKGCYAARQSNGEKVSIFPASGLAFTNLYLPLRLKLGAGRALRSIRNAHFVSQV